MTTRRDPGSAPASVADFPRRHAATQRFSLGRPRTVRVSPDGRRVWFVASDGPEDRVHHLWLHAVADGTTRRVLDGTAGDDTTLTDEERARRERLREGGGGIVSLATDDAAARVVVVLGGVVQVVDATGTVLVVEADGAMFDPRPSPDGRRLVGVVDGAVHLADLPADLADGPARARRLVGPAPGEEAVSWGIAEFAAAEEMGRQRGSWFAPDGTRLLVTRVDESDVEVVHLADPVHPTRAPRPHRYPFAGTTNARVDLHLLELDADGGIVSDRVVDPPAGAPDEYLVDVRWEDHEVPLVTWQDRAQTRLVTAAVDVADATATTVAEVAGEPWVEPVPGVPRWVGDRVLTVRDLPDHGPEGTRGLVLGDRVVSPAGLQVRSVVAAEPGRLVVRASRDDPTSIGVWAVDPRDGTVEEVLGAAGVHTTTIGGDTRVDVTSGMDAAPTTSVVSASGRHDLPDRSADPGLPVEVAFHRVTDHGLHAGLLLPPADRYGDGPHPVLLDPYGGPHAQRVLRSRNAWLVPAWFAQQGYAVLVVDNRGAPGRSPSFEHALRDDMGEVVLADQVAALEAVTAGDDRLDPARVAIRGWSFGGFLAGLAALRRPDVVRAAIVGAPVTDQRLYDTHYTERYLGHPDDAPDAYRASSLVDADGSLVEAVETDDPVAMLVIHGLVDDNVLVAHSLRLSRALLAAGRPHQFLPLSGVTHMTPQEEVAANLLRLQLDFLDRVLRP